MIYTVVANNREMMMDLFRIWIQVLMMIQNKKYKGESNCAEH